jgi:hypothetical protein
LQFANNFPEESICLSNDFRPNRAKDLLAYFLPTATASLVFLHGQKSQATLDFAPSEMEILGEKQSQKFTTGILHI